MKFSELDRIKLLYKSFTAKRESPPLEALETLKDPKKFSLAILPFVSRTFSLFISLLPNKTALPCTVAYLYCRILDSYEDLVNIDNHTRKELLKNVPKHLQGEMLLAPEMNDTYDGEDRAAILLIKKSHLVREAFFVLPPKPKESITRLVNTMSEGMCTNIDMFEKNHGCLTSISELQMYCYNVAGCVGEFLDELFQWYYNDEIISNSNHKKICSHLGEILQMVNMAKDIEKDFSQGRVYEPNLGNFVRTHRIRALTEEHIDMARRHLVNYVTPLFHDIHEYLSFHKYSWISRGRGAILFPFIMAHQIYKTMESNKYTPRSNKKILWSSVALSLQAMFGKRVRFV